MSFVLHLLLYSSSLFIQLATPHSLPAQETHSDQNPNLCSSSTTCGGLQIPFPFYLNATTSASCPRISDAFRLSCVNSSSLFLNIASESYRVLHFSDDGVLVDFPNTSICRQYNDLKSFPFSGNQFFGISTDNVLDLNDCEDSSLCKADCSGDTSSSVVPGCDGGQGGGASRRYPSCCYPLSDRSSNWRPGQSFSEYFSQFGCRGFSSWIILPGSGSRVGKRGVKLEWAVPGNSSEATCSVNADIVNATSVASGIRCQCRDGFLGDGFPIGIGCLKSCFKDGKELRGNDCYRNNHGRKKKIILAGVIITSALTIVTLIALCLSKRRMRRSDKFVSDKEAHCQSAVFSQKACRSRLFTYHELEEATKGFGDNQKIVEGTITTLYAGVLVCGGSHVAVQRLQYCQSERDLIQVLFRLETLSSVSHRNIAHIIGWSIDVPCPLVVYDYPENGTFKEHLHRARDENIPLDWYRRLSIAAQTASLLAFLHHEISPPIFHHDLQSGFIFLDTDFSVKLAGFELQDEEINCHNSRKNNDVYGLGLVLVEIITGNTTTVDFPTVALQKIKKGKLEEIVDPSLYYHEQAPFCREQIEIIADLATRCLLFGVDGKLVMADVARELVHMTKDCVDGSSRRGPVILEETFSNSSLLQMISMSPDSIYVP